MKGSPVRWVLFLVLCVGVVSPAFGLSLDSDSDSNSTEVTTITDYVADFTVAKDGDLRAVETVTVKFPVGAGKHGIFRFFDTRDPSAPHAYRLPHDIAVRQDQKPAETKMEWQHNHRYRVIRIGNPDKHVSAGTHVYKISYSIDGVLEEGTHGHRTQFFWDLIPSGWEQRIQHADLTVHLPAAARDPHCTIGGGRPCNVSGAGSRTVHLTAGPLAAETAVTVRAGLDMATPPAGNTLPWTGRWVAVLGHNLLWLIGIAILALVAAAVGIIGTRRTKEPKPGFPLQYAPPDGIGPAQGQYIRAEDTSREMYVASIMQAAEKGAVRIAHDKESWTITDTGSGWDDLDPITRNVHDLTAGATFTTSSKDPDQGEKLKDAMAAFDDSVESWALDSDLLVPSGSKLLRSIVGFSGIGAVALVVWNPIGMTVSAIVPGLLAVCGAGVVAKGAATKHTPRGRDLWSRVQGFHRILSTPSAEARFDFASRKDRYVTYLPWAVAFGCADEWAAKYETEMGTAAPVPAYFGGYYAGSMGAGLGSMVDSFSSTLDSAISSYEATQSSSSGGGGGGGGGGGSW